MRLRPRRRTLIGGNSPAVPAVRSGRPGRPRSARPGRARRIRWWLRVGALLAVIGVSRLARTARTRWEPLSLLAGALLAVTGLVLPAATGAFFLGLLVLIATLLKGISEQGRRRAPGYGAAARFRADGTTPGRPASLTRPATPSREPRPGS